MCQATMSRSSPAARPCPTPAVVPRRWRFWCATASICPPASGLHCRPECWKSPNPAAPPFLGPARAFFPPPPQHAAAAAAEAARAAGLAAHLLSDEIEGEAREVGRVHAALARSVARRGQPFARPCVILSGGETSVTVRPRAPGVPAGRGGRAGEFCLGLAQALQGQGGVWALAADTDGIDGSEDNAGVFVDPDTLARAEAQGLRCAEHLARNDAWGFFAKLDDLLLTGPTYTNVNDFRALLIL